MTGLYFEFDGISSKDLGLMIVNFDGVQNGTASVGSIINFNTIKLPDSTKWFKTSSSYDEVLSFSFQAAKLDHGNKDISISERELSYYLRWLIKKDYKFLRIFQDGYENIYYNAQLSVQRYQIAGETVGLDITVTCNAPFGYSQIRNFNYTTDKSQDYFELYDDSDETGYLYPETMEIEVMNDGDVILKNTLEGRETIIKNCKAGSVIVFTQGLKAYIQVPDSDTQTFQASSIADNFNWKFPRICNTFQNRLNGFETTNIRNISIAWRAVRKAVC